MEHQTPISKLENAALTEDVVGVDVPRLVRLVDIPPTKWPQIMPPGTQFRDIETGEWIEDYAGWDRQKAMEDLASEHDRTGAQSLRIPLPNS